MLCRHLHTFETSLKAWRDSGLTRLRVVHAQTRAVALLCKAAEMCDDDTRLQRVVPYLLVRGLPGMPSGAPLRGTMFNAMHVLELSRHDK